MFSKIKEAVVKYVVGRSVIKMLDKVKGALNGNKTYITVVLGIIVAVVGMFWGPVEVGPINIPAMESSEAWTIIWNGLMFLFLRKGVKQAEK